MIELLPGLPDPIVGLLASGQMTAQDYESVVIPAIESKLQAHGAVRVLYQLGPAFTGFTAGAMWDDASGIYLSQGVGKDRLRHGQRRDAGCNRPLSICHPVSAQGLFQWAVCRGGRVDNGLSMTRCAST